MARKRKPRLNPKSKDYWNKLLTRMGLSMERGRSARLKYVGDSSAIEGVDAHEQSADKGKVKSKPIDF
jgi:hypothetical protein